MEDLTESEDTPTEDEQATEAAIEEAPSPPSHVTIGELQVRLAAPVKFSICLDVVGIYSVSIHRCYFAALGLCWRKPLTQKPKAIYAFNALSYGGEVMDELVATYPWEDLLQAGRHAYEHMAYKAKGQMLVTEEKVKSTEDFTGAPKGN